MSGFEGVQISDGVTALFAPVSSAGQEAPDGWIQAAGLLEEQDQGADLLMCGDDGAHFSEAALIPWRQAQECMHLRAEVGLQEPCPGDQLKVSLVLEARCEACVTAASTAGAFTWPMWSIEVSTTAVACVDADESPWRTVDGDEATGC